MNQDEQFKKKPGPGVKRQLTTEVVRSTKNEEGRPTITSLL